MDAFKCRAFVEVEMLSVMGNGIWDFTNCPSLNDVCNTFLCFFSLMQHFAGCKFIVGVSVEG